MKWWCIERLMYYFPPFFQFGFFAFCFVRVIFKTNAKTLKRTFNKNLTFQEMWECYYICIHAFVYSIAKSEPTIFLVFRPEFVQFCCCALNQRQGAVGGHLQFDSCHGVWSSVRNSSQDILLFISNHPR